MHQEIWMASYLQPARFRLFKRALKSFNEQTLKVPVVLSVCGPEAWRVVQWARNLLTCVPYELFLYDRRWSQFDQLYMIYCSRKNKDIFISVCDDDDFFYTNRIEIQQRYLYSSKITLKCQTNGTNDFGSYCFHFKALHDFFTNKRKEKHIQEMLVTVPPDVVFICLQQWTEIPYILHFRRSAMFDRTWHDKREGGGKWFAMEY